MAVFDKPSLIERAFDLLETGGIPTAGEYDAIYELNVRGSQTAYGTAGADLFQVTSGGNKTMVGGDGDDVYLIDASWQADIIEEADSGRDMVIQGRSLWGYRLPDYVEDLVMTEGSRNARGNLDDNILIGTSGQNKIKGDSGDDVLVGHGGNDLLIGGAGNDVAIFAGAASDYTVSHIRGADYAVTDASGVTAKVRSVESLVFGDGTIMTLANGEVSVADETFGNEAPTAEDDTVTVDADTAITRDPGEGLLSNDTDDRGVENLDVVAVEGQAVNVGETLTFGEGLDVTVWADGALHANPTGDYRSLAEGDSATAQLTYTVGDESGEVDQASVAITVQGVNDGPVAANDAVETDEDTVIDLAYDVLANDFDPDTAEVLEVAGVNGDSSVVGSAVTLDSGATLTLQANGLFTYNPNGAFDSLNSGESTTDSFTYTVRDSQGATDTATVTVGVQGRDDAVSVEGSWSYEAVAALANEAPVASDDGESYILSQRGDETISGTSSADVFEVASSGTKIMSGLAGDDAYVIGDPWNSTVLEEADQGHDTVYQGQGVWAYELGANVENLVLHDGSSNGKGNTQDNVLVGNAGANKLKGFEGDDFLYGAGGSDLLKGGAGTDTAFVDGSVDDYQLKTLTNTAFDLVDGNGVSIGLRDVENVEFQDGSTLDLTADNPTAETGDRTADSGETDTGSTDGETAMSDDGGATLTVGSSGQYDTLQAAVDASMAGDRIEIEAGTYTDVAVTIPHSLSIVGVGGMATLDWTGNAGYNGNIQNGKGILVTQGGVESLHVENIAFEGASVADRNGAGIRHQGGELTVVNSEFTDNENGILASYNSAGVTIQGSTFKNNGYGDGLSHGIYIKSGDTLLVEDSTFTGTNRGHHVKSVVLESTIVRNTTMDDAGGDASLAVDVSGGGDLLVENNTIVQSPNADNAWTIAYSVLRGEQSGTIDIVGNTFENQLDKGDFLLNRSDVFPTISDNTFTTPNGVTFGNLSNAPAFVSNNTLNGQSLADGTPYSDAMAGATEGADTLVGTDGDDVIYGQGGDDVLEGGIMSVEYPGVGNDVLLGGDGNDMLRGGNDDDALYGELGQDHLEGGSQKDLLAGGDGNDVLDGGDGNDLLFGGDGDDIIFGDTGSDTVVGGNGIDTVVRHGNYEDFSIRELRDGRLRVNGDSSVEDQYREHYASTEYLQFDDGVYDIVNGTFTPGAQQTDLF